MRQGFAAGLLTLLATTQAIGQPDRNTIYTNPLPPPRAALERLNLKLAWSVHVPMDGTKDGLVTIRLTGKRLLVQTRSGLVAELDAETGRILWRTRVGNPYQILQPLTYNNNMVFALNNNYLYGLDRSDGTVQYQMTLPGGIAAPPIADDDQIYLPTVAGQLRAYRLPNLAVARLNLQLQQEEEARAAAMIGYLPKTGAPTDAPRIVVPPRGAAVRIGPQPVEVWMTARNLRVDYQPLLSNDTILATASNGTLTAFSKYQPPEGGTALPAFSFEANGAQLVSPGQYADVCYLGSGDGNLYAIHMGSGRVIWRYTTGTPVTRQPLATRSDVFVSSERKGLARVDRTTGEALWRVPVGRQLLPAQPEVDRVLAVNPKFVYGTDRSGRMVILDRARGTILSTWDVRDFVFQTPNDWTDRLYLAAQNGLIVCLHDREYVNPHYHRDLENSLLRKLTLPFSLPPVTNKPLKELLREIGADRQIKILISRPAFTDRGLVPPDDVAITENKIEGTTLKDGLQKILDRMGVDATFEAVEDTILIVPKREAAKPPDMNPKPPDPGM